MPVKAITVTKVSLTSFKPRMYGFGEYQERPLSVGYLIGEVTRLTEKTDTRDGAKYNGLGGNFRAIVSKHLDIRTAIEHATEGAIIQSGICYMPDAFQGPIEDAFNAMENGTVRFAMRVLIARRGESEYQWQVEDLMPVTSQSPLDLIAEEAAGSIAITDRKQADPEPASNNPASVGASPTGGESGAPNSTDRVQSGTRKR